METRISPAQRSIVEAFDPRIRLTEAVTPPTSWYADPSFLSLEFERVFFRGWQAVDWGILSLSYAEMLMGIFMLFIMFAATMLSLLASGSRQKSSFVRPYHGWTYGLDGALLKATRIMGIKNFNEDDNKAFIQGSLEERERVQGEDIALCEGV